MAGELEIELGAEPMPGAPIEIEIGKEVPQKVVAPEEGVESLKEARDRAIRESQERQRAAERLVAESAARAVNAEKKVVEVQKTAIDGTIEGIKKDRAAAKQEFIAAQEAGDYTRAADAQERMADAAARLVAAEQGRVALNSQPEPTAPVLRPQELDAVERAARDLAPRAADWIRLHPECVTSPSMNARMMSAHYAALGEGVEPNTDAYFTLINQRLGFERAPDRQEERRQEVARDPYAHRAVSSEDVGANNRAPVAAPVSRSAPMMSDNPRRSGKVRLSAAEQDAAIAMNLDPVKSRDEILRDYALNKVALEEEGLLGTGR